MGFAGRGLGIAGIRVRTALCRGRIPAYGVAVEILNA